MQEQLTTLQEKECINQDCSVRYQDGMKMGLRRPQPLTNFYITKGKPEGVCKTCRIKAAREQAKRRTPQTRSKYRETQMQRMLEEHNLDIRGKDGKTRLERFREAARRAKQRQRQRQKEEVTSNGGTQPQAQRPEST